MTYGKNLSYTLLAITFLVMQTYYFLEVLFLFLCLIISHPSSSLEVNFFQGKTSYMSVDAVDAEAFAIALNGDITGAVLHMKRGEYWTYFPLVSLVTADGLPGLVITPPYSTLAFLKEVPSWPEDLVEVVKDNMVIAMIEGVIFPSCVGEGRKNGIPYLDNTTSPTEPPTSPLPPPKEGEKI
jgi:hypothetical protein